MVIFFVHLKLKLKVKINAHGKKKKLEPNQNDAPDHFLSAKCLHTRPTFGSNDRFLLFLNSMGFSQAKPDNKISGYLIVIQDFQVSGVNRSRSRSELKVLLK